MKIMFVGLGLIGGSMAMALEGYPDLERYAVDGDEPTRLEALGRGVVRAAWPNADDAPVEDMDIIVICLHPEAAADFVRAQAGRIRPGALLTDVCGVKRPLFEAVGEVRERTFIYLGGHPMAGRERGGFAHATADLFRGAHYILTPDAGVPQESIRLMERLVTFMGCADVVFSDPAAHDERIAYTSQLMHVMALALCDQHLLFDSYGFEGGSFRGATRVAALDPKLWCELFWANKETLANLTDELTERLAEYSALLAQMNPHFLYNSLESISAMARLREQEEIVNAIRLLSQLLRGSLSSGIQEIPLSGEIEYVSCYLEMQRIITGDRLTWDIDVDDTLQNAPVPRLILQPIVENAILHGLDEMLQDAVIIITADVRDKQLVLTVSDNGKGADQAMLDALLSSEEEIENPKEHRARIGIQSVLKRIHILYGTDYGMTMESELGSGMTLRIYLPYDKKKNTDRG